MEEEEEEKKRDEEEELAYMEKLNINDPSPSSKTPTDKNELGINKKKRSKYGSGASPRGKLNGSIKKGKKGAKKKISKT